MKKQSVLLVLVIATQAYSAPQFITFKDGKLGVNFGGYHAGVGLGGLAGGSGAAGGLYAEAGTPHGQAARAGLGGTVDGNGGSAGGLFAGATAGGNINAAAGLGGIAAEKTAGGGFAAAQAGPHYAASGLGGASSVEGSTGFTYSGSKSYQAPAVIKEEVIPIDIKPVHAQKKVHTEFKFDAENEVRPVPLSPVQAHADAKVDVSAAAAVPAVPTVIIRDDSPPPTVTRFREKHIIHTKYKPHRHHVHHKTAYIGGYVGGGADLPPPPPIQKRIDAGAEAGVGGAYGHEAGVGGGYGGSGHVTHEVIVNKNPAFFQDIFNIPISTLKAVGNFLSNTAGSTSVSVQKSASIQAEPNSSPKHASSSSSSEAHLSVETPSVSKIIDDIFAIPINTLGAVNKFLENNVPARKRIQIQSESGEPTSIRLGPHARRRANKRIVIVEEKPDEKPEAFEKPQVVEKSDA